MSCTSSTPIVQVTRIKLPQPLVSVVIPAYNAEAFLESTLKAICNQSYTNLEIIVVDDGSVDRTPGIVRKFSQQDVRVHLLQQPNAGVAAARNHGIQHAKGEFVAPIDADDIWHPDAVAKLVERFQASSSAVGVVYTWSVDINEQDQLTGGFHVAEAKGNVHKTLICHYFLGNASSTLIRKLYLDLVGGYNSQLKAQNAQGCEDWDLYLRLAEHCHFEVVPEFLVGYRKITNSMSGNFEQMARSQQLMLQTVKQKHPKIPSFLYRLSRSSFYLYLSQQRDLQDEAYGTLYWLWQAVKVDPLTPILRLGLYILLVKNFLRILLKQPLKDVRNITKKTFNSEVRQEFSSGQRFYHFSLSGQPKINNLKIWFRSTAGKILHWSLSLI